MAGGRKVRNVPNECSFWYQVSDPREGGGHEEPREEQKEPICLLATAEQEQAKPTGWRYHRFSFIWGTGRPAPPCPRQKQADAPPEAPAEKRDEAAELTFAPKINTTTVPRPAWSPMTNVARRWTSHHWWEQAK